MDQRRFLHCISALALSIVILNPLWADDTEIFFSTPPESNPNLLFILDGSGSMARFDCANGTSGIPADTCGEDDASPNATTTRLTRMVNALTRVLENVDDVNVGLMRFSHAENGGRVTYPIRPISEQICEGGCQLDSTFDITARGQESTDDAYENTSSNVIATDLANPLMSYDSDQTAFITGLRFPDLRVPQGATIVDARIEFTSVSNAVGATNLSFEIEDTQDSLPYDGGDQSISNRSWTTQPVNWNDIPPWTVDETAESPNLAALLSTVVNRPDWCGGNAASFSITGSGDRLISAFERGDLKEPVLKVKFSVESVPANGGCNTATLVTSIGSSGNDAREKFAGTNAGEVKTGTNNQLVTANYMSGFSFNDINIPQGADIREARLQLTTTDRADHTYGEINIDITLENNANPEAFTSTDFDLSYRQRTTGTPWSVSPSTINTTSTTSNLAPLFKDIIGRTEWVPGNSVNVFLKSASGSGQRSFVSYDNNSSSAATLSIDYTTNITVGEEEVAGPVVDVRSQLIDQLSAFKSASGTPTVGALLEARRYFAGDLVDYGKTRGPSDGYLRKSRVSHPDSYTGGEHFIPDGCGTDLNSSACQEEEITGTPTYISPIEDECQSNHVILLTDGAPSASSRAVTGAHALIGVATCEATTNDKGTCGVEVADYMNGKDEDDPDGGTYEDLRADIDGDQTLTVHTIGFNVDHNWLSAIADAGGGDYYTANSAVDLVDAVNNILAKVKETDTTFVAPGATIDSFSRISHRQDIYLALFQPGLRAGWKGNLKKFELKGNPPEVYDANDEKAIDSELGIFKSSSKSFWSTVVDGNQTNLGGAASKLDPSTRNLTTYFQADTENLVLTDTQNLISETHSDVTSLLGDDALEIIEWLYGMDIKDDDGDDEITDHRNHIGDPLHTSPVLVTYGGTADNPQSVTYFGTNEGFVHGIDTATGDELFAFMPSHLIPNLTELYNSSLTGFGRRPYGMDGDITLRTIDNNKNGIIETGDQAYLYLGMRRGGRNYYSLDVSNYSNTASNKIIPEFNWQIIGGSGDFVELAETWSKPTPASINLDGTLTKVLIFGGGYDNAQDTKINRTPDTKGRAIYIVEADDPTKVIWAGSINPQGATTEVFTGMKYSFPSDINVVSEGEGNLASQFYVGDMGGQIWRFDVNNGSSGTDLIDGGIIADLGGDGANNRRFYHPPDLSLARSNNKTIINIAIGSGYQAHPLNTTIDDKFFLIGYPYKPTGDYGMQDDPDADPENLVYRSIKIDDIYNATYNLIGEGDTDQIKTQARKDLAKKQGWYITMEESGEKILGQSNTFEGVIRFTSYLPSSETINCGPDIGASRFWAVNLEDGTPDSNSIAENIENPTRINRHASIPGGGIAPPVRALFVEHETTVTPVVLSGANILWQGDDVDLTTRWFWAESPD